MIDKRVAVLVVEDEPMIRMDMVEALEEAGFLVFDAASVAGALLVLAAHSSIRAIITDIDMPGSLTGLDLAASVRRHDNSMAIVVASGRSDVPLAELPRGGRYVSKPYSSIEVASSLCSMLAAA